jgi:diguanylate cyclase
VDQIQLTKSASTQLTEADLAKFNELMEASFEMAKKLLPFLVKRRIPLIPENYRLFYDYFLAIDTDLVRELNTALSSEDVFSVNTSRRLYKLFYHQEPDQAESILKMGERIGTISRNLEDNLGQSLNSTGHFQQILSDSVNLMKKGEVDAGEIKILLGGLLDETNSALSTQTALSNYIETTSCIIASLTAELKDKTMQANIDEMTQLYNRRYWLLRFEELTANYDSSSPLSLIIFDLDRFKSINDTWGHPVGDKVIIVCARIIRAFAGDMHLACRYGGEEFVILCSALGVEKTRELAEGVRKKVEETKITYRGQVVPVTVSAGITLYVPGESERDFIDRADKALYQAKSQGRNQVVDCLPE